MAYVPPLFSKFGKSVKDLLTKKYDYKNQLVLKNKLQADLTFENTVNLGDQIGQFSGAVKSVYTNKSFGEVEVEVGTDGAASTEVRATKLQNGLAVTVKGTQKPSGRVNVEYRQESVATSVGFDYAKANSVDASLVAGLDNLAVGGTVKYDISASNVSDYNFGSEYSTKDYTATVKTEDKLDTLTASFFHNVPGTASGLKTQLGAQFSWDQSENKRVLTVAAEHDVDAVTGVKGKINTDGVVAAVVEHKLANPVARLAFSAEWAASKRNTTPEKYGFALTFGEY